MVILNNVIAYIHHWQCRLYIIALVYIYKQYCNAECVNNLQNILECNNKLDDCLSGLLYTLQCYLFSYLELRRQVVNNEQVGFC